MISRLIRQTSFQNLILRGSGSAGKLFLSLFIGFYLGEETLGTYGLINSTMILSLYIIGFEFFNYSTREIIEKNIFKKEEKERLSMTIALYAHNESKKINANTKSELFIDKAKILGFTTQKDSDQDSKTVLKNAVKQVSILLKDGFEKLQSSER